MRTIRITLNRAVLALAAVLCAIAATSARAGGADEAASVGLQELDEILVHGKSLSRRIEEAENKLFRRYNKLNKNDEFDVVCGAMSLQPGSMIMLRTCLPGFIADFVPTGLGARYARVASGPMSYLSTISNCSHPAMTINYDMDGTPYQSASASPCSVDIPIGPPPSRAVTAMPAEPIVVNPERREAYAKNFIKVTLTDTKLLEMASDLTKLYEEMDEVQGRYSSASKANPAPQRVPAKPTTGPRRM